jgi:hypothetical protein
MRVVAFRLVGSFVGNERVVGWKASMRQPVHTGTAEDAVVGGRTSPEDVRVDEGRVVVALGID